MVDVDTNTILIAAITSFSTIMGGVIVLFFNSRNKRQRIAFEVEKIMLDKEHRGIELRNQAYIRFLSLRAKAGFDPGTGHWSDLNSELVEESVALILTHGSPKIASLLVDAYPFKSLEEVDEVKKAIKRELVHHNTNFKFYNLPII